MIKRELYLEKIRRLINTEPIKIITGVRRSGKTYLLHSIKEELIEQGISKENIFLISFESQKYNKIQNFRELDVCVNNLIKNTSGKIYLLFDEIQNIMGWEKSINSYRVDFDCDMFHIYNCIHFLLHQVLLTFLSNSRIDGRPKILECRKNVPIIPYIKAELFYIHQPKEYFVVKVDAFVALFRHMSLRAPRI